MHSVETNPGAVAPTADYDIVLNDVDGLDVAGGALLNRHTSVTEKVYLGAGYPVASGAWTWTVTGNLVNSAVVVAKLMFSAEAPPVSMGALPLTETTQPASMSALAVSGPGRFSGLVVKTDGVNAVTLNVFDSASAAGNRILPQDVVIPGNAGVWAYSENPPLRVHTGIYVGIAIAGGGSASYQVRY